MPQVLVTEQYLDDIANAIRSKNGSESTYTPAQMAGAIEDIHTADEVVLVQKTVNANGQYNASDDSADGYSGVRVNVPNTYSASDEGKVVSNGDLVAQTTKQIMANGTYDTTRNNQVVVNISGGGGDSNVTVSTLSPTASDGNIGDIWVKYAKSISDLDITGQRTYKISILRALRGASALSYAGAAEIDIIFDDGNGNEVSMRDMNDFSYRANRGGSSNAFDNNRNTYWEGNPVEPTNPLTMSMTATIPAEYKFKRLSVMQRSYSYTSDVWKEFTLSLNENPPFIHKENLSVNDWAGANNYTYFIKDDGIRYEIIATYIKIGETEEAAVWVGPASIEVSINE